MEEGPPWTQRLDELSGHGLAPSPASEVAPSVLGACWSSGDTNPHLGERLVPADVAFVTI